mmetsp:Transcript_40450/g.61705  ORF Transcript_40450/g.61705 Transcript_40450/m.61705 type:complete len:206 (-) Transcript_40450:362-979(-)
MLEVMNKFENEVDKDLEMRLDERGAFVGNTPQQAIQGQQGAPPDEGSQDKKKESDTVFDVESSDQSSALIEQHTFRRVLSTAKTFKKDKMAFQVNFLRETKEKKSTTKASLLDQLSSAFKKRFLDPSIGNKYKALKRQKEELATQAAEMAFKSYKYKAYKSHDRLGEVLNNHKMKPEAKNQFVDKQIEKDILYFNPQFHSNNQQI